MKGYRRLPRPGLLTTLRRTAPIFGTAVALCGAAVAGEGWDGTWHGGFDNDGDGVQIVMIGPQVTAFYFHGDYLDPDSGTMAADGSITFHWDGGQGRLAEDGDKPGLTVHETGNPDRVIPLERDN